MAQFEVNTFIKEQVIFRNRSFFESDLVQNEAILASEINGKSVLVIGGAGTIGSNFIKALLKFKPASLVVVDTNENGLTELVRDLRSTKGLNVPYDFITYPIDFGSRVFEKLLSSKGPFQIVANFAAHKHVRSEKDMFSIEAMLENNLFKAERFLKQLNSLKPEHFFCVSTDKAANPVNVMGASKKLMEHLILSYSNDFKTSTARFANVAFSNGSLLAGFIERMHKRQALACPSDIRRFFVSPEESGEICLMAAILGKSGQIFFPKFDFDKDQTYFIDIVERFLKAYKKTPVYFSSDLEALAYAETLSGNEDAYPVYRFISETSGEKPYEEFYSDEEQISLDQFNGLGIIQPEIPNKSKIIGSILDLESIFENKVPAKSEIVKCLKELLPDFQHIETGKNLDQKI